MLRRSMASITRAVLHVAEQAGPSGIAMGRLVDALERDGHPVEDIEQAVWTLLGQRRLTPSGFVCRSLRQRSERGRSAPLRVYEFLLAPWSAELDGQLELELDGSAGG
jgi:hypothetical protein